MACFENRVKNSLAYLSAVDSTPTELVRLSPIVSPSKPRSIQKLLERIRTFSQTTWFAKPDWLSPVNCARLGWQNVDVDLLACSKCKAIVSAKLPSSQNVQVYDECCKRLESLLQSGHRNGCSRKSQPTSPDLCRLTLRNRSAELQDFIDRVKGLIELKSHLQIIEESAFASLKLTADDVVPLCQLATEVCPHFVDVDLSVLMSACILAICGWSVSTSTTCGELIECKFCDRKIGLWNYFSQNPDFDEEATTAISGYYDNDDGDLAGNDLEKAACNSTSVTEETGVHAMNECTDVEVTGVGVEQCFDSTDGRIPDPYRSPEESDKEQKIAGDVPLQFPHEIQTDVSNEALVTDSVFGGAENEQLRNEEITRDTQFLTGATGVLRTADAFCSAETLAVAEVGMTVQATGPDGGLSQEASVLGDAELGTEHLSDGSKKSQNEDIFGPVETCQEECVTVGVEREEESAGINSVRCVEGSDVTTDLSGNCVGTCDAMDSGAGISASAVFPIQHNLGAADVGGSGGEDDDNRSDEIDGRQQELTEATNAVAGEALSSASDDIASAADGEVTGGVSTIDGISEEHSGGQVVDDGFQCGAEDAVAGLDDGVDGGVVEQGGSNESVESNDDATSLNSVGGNLCQPVNNSSNNTDTNDRSTDELRDQPTAKEAVTPGQPSTQPPDELNEGLTDQLTSQPAVQECELTAQQANESNDQPTDQATVTLGVELEANDERDAERHCQESSKKRTATPEGSKIGTKRRRLTRPVRVHFDPLAEHRPWCIWVQDLVVKRRPRMSGGNEEELKDGVGCSDPQHPWIRLFRLLLQPNPPDNRDVRRALSVIKSF